MIEANERIDRKHACFVDVALIGSKEDRNFITYYIAFAINFVFFFSYYRRILYRPHHREHSVQSTRASPLFLT